MGLFRSLLIYNSLKRESFLREVEYLESTGSQYIDTGIIGKSGVTSEVGVMKLTSLSNECALGCWNDTSTRCWLAYFFGGNFYAGYGTNAGNMVTVSLNEWNTIKTEIDGSKYNYVINGTKYSYNNTTFNSTQNIYMFAMNNKGSSGYPSTVRISYAKIYDNGVLVRDFIPVLDLNSKPAMYDKVSGQLFYNHGDGEDFAYGREIHEVEYIESTGSQYVDTGIVPTENSRVVAKLMTNLDVGNKDWFGNDLGTGSYVFSSMSNTIVEYRFGDSGWQNANIGSSVVAIPFEVDFSKNGLIIGDKTISLAYTSFTDGDSTILLFKRNGGSNYMKGRMYYLNIYDGDKIVREYIPCVDENNKPFLFDRVSHKIFDNLGTDNFIVP